MLHRSRTLLHDKSLGKRFRIGVFHARKTL